MLDCPQHSLTETNRSSIHHHPHLLPGTNQESEIINQKDHTEKHKIIRQGQIKHIEKRAKKEIKILNENVSFENMFIHKNFLLSQTPPPSAPLEYKSYIQQLKSLPRKSHNHTNIKILLKTQYSIIHNLAHKYFNYKFYNKEDQFNEIFLVWIDTYVTEEFVKRLKGYQRINHFPNSCQLGRKDLLANNLNYARSFAEQQYLFYPKTWVLPKDCQSFNTRQSQNKFYIVKPHANCQGRGIYLTNNPIVTSKDEVIIQEYIDNPLLIQGNKFDLRIYVLLKSLQPLRIYVYKQGLCRLATCKYIKPNEHNFKNEKMHLTNYAINKNAPNFIGNKDFHVDNQGHKRSYTFAMKYLQSVGFNVNAIEQRIDSIIVKTFLAGFNKMRHSYRKTRQPYPTQQTSNKQQFYQMPQYDDHPHDSVCFELFGFDIMILQTGQPILLQVNHQPSLVTDSPLDLNIKKCLIMDTINLLNIQQSDKNTWQQSQDNVPSSSRPKCIEQKQLQSMGGYRRIYPLPHIKYGQNNQEQIQKAKRLQLYYDYFLNKFLYKYKESKSINKYKLNTNIYKTFQVKSHEKTENIHLSKYKIQKSLHQTNTSSTNRNNKFKNHKTIGLTFYNLFQNQQYQIGQHADQISLDKEDNLHINLSKMKKDAFKKIDQKYKGILRQKKLSVSFQQKQKYMDSNVYSFRIKAVQFKEKQEAQKNGNNPDAIPDNLNQINEFPNDFQSNFIRKLIKKKKKELPLYYSKYKSKSSIKQKQKLLLNNIFKSIQPIKNEIMVCLPTTKQKIKPLNEQDMANHFLYNNFIKKIQEEEYLNRNKLLQYKDLLSNSIREKVEQINNLKIIKNNFPNKDKGSERMNKYRVYNFGMINQVKKRQTSTRQ